MKKWNRRFLVLLVICPLLLLPSLFLGHGWDRPWELFLQEHRAILQLRLWRLGMGILVGASLAVSGAVLQAVLRNPLAEPYVLGLSAGAGLGMALGFISGFALLGLWAVPAAGLAGALLSWIVVYHVARVRRITIPHTLILAGVVWGSVCGSILMFIVSRSTTEQLHAVVWWFLGDLQVYDQNLVLLMAGITAVTFLLLIPHARHLDVLLLGEEMAQNAGLDSEKKKWIVITLCTILTASAVAVSGLIAFVGLVVPHAARAIVGPEHRRLLPASALCGATFLVWADGLGRMLLDPVEIPVGIVTALLGGPFFLILLRRGQREVWM